MTISECFSYYEIYFVGRSFDDSEQTLLGRSFDDFEESVVGSLPLKTTDDYCDGF